ncbi:hypothetical protein MNBD_GAMMA09-3874 [hydrothermal vent metagenome]|uniref:Uncharacterized protein n=1 Tax=hydrothermal vent metagenome TaxID=652676 RepID=A0A3B0XIZ5_9ZZZZ
MEIPFIYVLISAEIMLILFGLSATLIFLLMRKKSSSDPLTETPESESNDELDAATASRNYINYIEKEIERNTIKINQKKNNGEDIDTETDKEAEKENDKTDESDNEETDDEETDDNTSPEPDEKQSKLLEAREEFLLIEKTAAEKTEHEIHFWDSIYNGIRDLLDKYKNTEETTAVTETTQTVIQKEESKEKVFYIETQGKKIDGEVNKLKDIIYEQENALSSMQKAMASAESEHPGESESLSAIRENMEALERQLNDSKMCMEVLEMENERLQQEVDKIDARHNSLFEAPLENDTPEKEPIVDLEQMKAVIEQQELKIAQLIENIESLEIDTDQTDKLKETIGDFSRTAKEMMSCIAILEEENERLQASATTEEEQVEENEGQNAGENEDIDAVKKQLSGLEEELIKKDVAYAQLQDEFSSMETEYLAMYEAMHGEK